MYIERKRMPHDYIFNLKNKMTLYFDFKKIYEKFKKLSTFFEEVESVKLLIKLIDVTIHVFLQSK